MTIKIPDDQKSSAKRPFCPLHRAAREMLRSEEHFKCIIALESFLNFCDVAAGSVPYLTACVPSEAPMAGSRALF